MEVKPYLDELGFEVAVGNVQADSVLCLPLAPSIRGSDIIFELLNVCPSEHAC